MHLQRGFDLLQGGAFFPFKVHRSHADSFQTTGVYPGKGFQRQVHIQGDAVKSDASADGDADTAQLLVVDPDTSIPWITGCFDAPIRDGSYHGFFQLFDKVENTTACRFEIRDRIGHKLTRTMECDVPTALYVMELYAGIGQKRGRYFQIVTSAPSSHRKHRGVL